jgi:hypothetical protein
MNLCPYKYILGIPNKGVHQYRIFGFALLDIIGTIIGAAILSYFFKWSYFKTLILLFILAEFLHYIFCVPTTVMKLLFPKKFP